MSFLKTVQAASRASPMGGGFTTARRLLHEHAAGALEPDDGPGWAPEEGTITA